MLSRCFLDFSVGVRASVIGLSQISSFSLDRLSCIFPLLFDTCCQTLIHAFYQFPDTKDDILAIQLIQ